MGWLLDQQWLFTWPAMIAWSILVVLAVRIFAASLFRRLVRPERAYLAAYLTIPALFILGLAIVGVSGMPVYGFDNTNWAHWLGYLTLFFSPFGLPLVLGTPVVLVSDIVRRPWRGHQAKAN
jgi:hypothetical protein